MILYAFHKALSSWHDLCFWKAYYMKISRKHLIPKLAFVSAAVCAAMLAFTPNAKAFTNLTFSDQYVVGTTNPGNPPTNTNVASWINFMITLGLGQQGNIGNQTVTRSMNAFANLPNANAAAAVRNDSPVNLKGKVQIDLGATVGTYSYLFAKYDGQNDISQVWYVGDLSGVITIPYLGPLGHAISGYILFPSGAVPDGGTTVMLLGAALGALGMARRYIKS
jgi:hypothetical protein